MKKQHLKNYLKLGVLLFGISFLLTNCEKEFVENIEYQQNSRFNIKTLNREQIQSNASISRKLIELNSKDKGKTQTNSQAREIYNPEYGFTINTDFVKYIEDTENGNHSYSFPITRDNPTDDKLENLLLHSNLENGYDAYIIQYGFTANEYASLDENSINNYNTLLSPIDIDTSVFNNDELAKTVYGCSETWTYTTYTGHENGELHGVNSDGTCSIGCNYGTSEWVLTGISCGYYDDGSGGGGDTSTGTTPTGGGGGGGTSSDPTDPNYDPTDPNIHGNGGNPPILAAPAVEDSQNNDQNCQNLNQQSQDSDFTDKLKDLRDNMLPDNETGYAQVPADTTATSYNYTPLQGTNGESIDITVTPGLISGFYHTHYDIETQLSVFSLSDLWSVYELAVNGNVFDNSFTLVLITAHGTKYALKFTDTQAFVDFGNEWFSDWGVDIPTNPFYQSKQKEIEKIFYDMGIKPRNPNKNHKNEKKFAKFLDKYNIGLELFKSNNDFTQWEKVNPNGTTTPCN